MVQKNARAVGQQKGERGQENVGDSEQQADFAMVASKHVRCQNTTRAGRFAGDGGGSILPKESSAALGLTVALNTTHTPATADLPMATRLAPASHPAIHSFDDAVILRLGEEQNDRADFGTTLGVNLNLT